MVQVLLFSFVVMMASLVGVFTVWSKFGRFMEKNLGLLVSFSAGVFLVVAYQLAQEAVRHANNFGYALLWILAGGLLILLLFKILPGFHHHHQKGEEKEEHIDPRRMLLSDAIHNVGDGVLLTAAFIVSPLFGTLTAFSVFVHELAQEISEFFVLKHAGYSTKKALVVNFAISSTILIGSIGSYILFEAFEAFEVPLLGLAAGSFFVVVFHDLIPHSVREADKKHYLKHVAWFFAGVILIALVNTIVPHSHEHGHEEDESGHASKVEFLVSDSFIS